MLVMGNGGHSKNQPDTDKMSFLTAAIHDRWSVIRALFLVTIGGIMLAAILAALAWFVVSKLLPSLADYSEIEGIDTGHLVLKFRDGKQVAVVSVPAYQLAVPTGVILDTKKQITISAVGG